MPGSPLARQKPPDPTRSGSGRPHPAQKAPPHSCRSGETGRPPERRWNLSQSPLACKIRTPAATNPCTCRGARCCGCSRGSWERGQRRCRGRPGLEAALARHTPESGRPAALEGNCEWLRKGWQCLPLEISANVVRDAGAVQREDVPMVRMRRVHGNAPELREPVRNHTYSPPRKRMRGRRGHPARSRSDRCCRRTQAVRAQERGRAAACQVYPGRQSCLRTCAAPRR